MLASTGVFEYQLETGSGALPPSVVVRAAPNSSSASASQSSPESSPCLWGPTRTLTQTFAPSPDHRFLRTSLLTRSSITRAQSHSDRGQRRGASRRLVVGADRAGLREGRRDCRHERREPARLCVAVPATTKDYPLLSHLLCAEFVRQNVHFRPTFGRFALFPAPIFAPFEGDFALF